jgi:hypothetical protein
MRQTLFTIMAVVSAFGGQSAIISSTNGGAFVIPNSGPFTSATSTYVAARIDNLILPITGMAAIGNIGGLSLFINGVTGGDCGTPSIVMEDNVDTFSLSNHYVCAAIPFGATDIFFKAQRDVPNSRMILEVWNFDGSGYVQNLSAIDTIHPLLLPSGGTIGDNNSNLHLAFLKWGSGTQPINTQLFTFRPVQQQDSANLGDWNFEGNGTDASGNGLTITFSSAAYAPTTTHAPACVLQQVTFSTAFPAQLDGTVCYPLDGGTTLLPLWSYAGTGADGVTQTPTFSNTSVMQPTVTGLNRGSFNVQLRITDGGGNSTTVTVHDGVVVTDANHVVNSMGNSAIDKLYMPLMQWGQNGADPWLYNDDRQKYYSDFFGGLLASTYLPTFNVAQAGTIACTHGTTGCTISGANAKAIFCAGGTSGIGDQIVVWYNSGANRGLYTVNACPTTSTITLAVNYRDATLSGAFYALFTPTDQSNWFGASNNADYYDVVAAQCSLYYRSGIDTAYTYCHTLGTYWWQSPTIDQGNTCDNGGAYPCTAPRIRGLLGLVTLALDGTLPNFWMGAETYWEASYEFQLNFGSCSTIPVFDLRECSAVTAMVAYFALFETGTNQTNALNALSHSVGSVWLPLQRSDGSIATPATFNPAGGTVAVTHGSTTVVGTGTGWSGGQFPPGNGFFTSATSGLTCTGADNVDAIVYSVTFVDASHLTISPAYQGATASGRFWQYSNLNGCGVQPFMMGFNAKAMYYSYLALSGHDATNAARAKTILLNDVNWLVNNAFFATSAAPAEVLTVNGLAYGAAGYPDCPTSIFTNPNCSGIHLAGTATTFQLEQDLQNSRYLAAETMSAYGYAYLLGPTTTIKTNADLLFGAIYGGQGGPASDIHFAWMELGKPGQIGVAQLGIKPKDFGFSWGWGNGSLWPAARLGSVPGSIPGGIVTSGVVSAGMIH